jgi:serine/threonine-protein kinase RsbT
MMVFSEDGGQRWHDPTGFGPGLGLGGARRLSNEFELQSTPGKSTRVRIARWRP